jgi:hypothetical protein
MGRLHGLIVLWSKSYFQHVWNVSWSSSQFPHGWNGMSHVQNVSFSIAEMFFLFFSIPRLYLSGKFSFVVTITAYTSIDMLLMGLIHLPNLLVKVLIDN